MRSGSDSGEQKRRHRARVLRFSIATMSLLAAFIMSVSLSNGVLQFSWKSKSLLAQPQLEEGAYDLSSIVILNRVLLQLQENYVDSGRFDPRWMLASGINEVQEDVPEIVASFDKSLADGPTEVTLRVGDTEQRFRFGDIESLWEMSLKYKEIFRFIQEHSQGEVARRDIEYAAINGLLDTLDPHSVLLSPETYKDMLEGNRGNFGGLGIVIHIEDGHLVVVRPMEGDTPATKAGILKGDTIVQINNQATLNMSVSEAVDLLRGEPGTDVSLWIMRDVEGWDAPKEFVLTRDEIKIPSVESANLGDGIGYVQLQGFQSNTYRDMVEHLEKLEQETGGLQGLVLDLRGNPGGLLDQAIKISDEFLESGNIVTTVGSGRRYKKPYDAKVEGTQPDYPIVVLVNAGSASASEIVAGALKNHDRALILGDTTFGKGSVQVLYELQDGSALKLTIAQYLTPGEVSIQSVGIVPDIKLVPMDAQDLDDPDLFLRRWMRREATLESHLEHQSARTDQKYTHLLKYLAQPREKRVDTPDPEEDGDNPDDPSSEEEEGVEEEADEDDAPEPGDDPEVRVARELLLAAGKTSEREAMLSKLTPVVKRLQGAEDAALSTHLSTLGLDWSTGSAQGDLSKLTLDLVTSQPQNTLDAGGTLELTATVTNTGTAPAYRVYGLSDSTNNDFEDLELLFGHIPAGASVSRTLPISLPKHELTRFDRVDVHLFEDMGLDNASQKPFLEANIGIGVRGRERPHFLFNYTLIDHETGNGDGFLSPGESVVMRAYVENDGEGPAPKPIVYLKNMNGDKVYLEYARETFEGLEVGDRQHFDFRFRVEEIESETAKFELHVYDEQLGQAVSQEIAIPVKLQPKPPTARQGVATLTAPTPLLGSPHANADTLSALASGEQLAVEATQGPYVRVARGEMRGWIAASSATLSDGALTHDGPSNLALKAFGSAPRIRLQDDVAQSTQDTFTVEGVIEDDGSIRDVYIFVINENHHVFDSRKVAYLSVGAPKHPLSVEVPIQPGMNRIKVVARDNLDQEASRSMYLFKP